ncbi:MAG: hypothetical protein IPM17_00280 [Verrucomicrobia bacterium]|nr:hypothetical protein [Verrucomicrobiota bacterium]
MEPLFSESLSGWDRHRPPSLARVANQNDSPIAALAYDLMVAIKLLDVNNGCRVWRVKTLMKKLALVPGRMAWHSRQWVARMRVPAAWRRFACRSARVPPNALGRLKRSRWPVRRPDFQGFVLPVPASPGSHYELRSHRNN